MCSGCERGTFVVTFGAVAWMYRLLVLTPNERVLGLVFIRVDNPGSMVTSLHNIRTSFKATIDYE